ncbi:MAG TPA: class I SAM-dependent methyltransferase [Rhizomicrobium sp.]
MMTEILSHNARLSELAQFVGRDWKTAASYYDAAERDMDRRWDALIWPFIADCRFTVCLDLAAGHGRNTRKLLEQRGCERVYAVDINQENVDFCLQRFENEPRVTSMRNDGYTIGDVGAGSVTLLYSFDAMVHFDSDVVRSYLAQIARLLDPHDGRAFLHHSNYSGNPGGNVRDNPHWRNFMSAALMAHYGAKEGLTVVRQTTLDWARDRSSIDCLTLFRKS